MSKDESLQTQYRLVFGKTPSGTTYLKGIILAVVASGSVE